MAPSWDYNMETSNGTTELSESTQKLTEDLSNMAKHTRELMESGMENLDENTAEIRTRLRQALDVAKDTCEKLEAKAVQGAKATDRAIRSNPYQSIGIALVAGFVIGTLIKRK